MSQFLIAAGFLTLLAIGFVAWPLWRGKVKLDNHRRQANRLIYQERIATIDADLKIGRLSTEQAQALRDEVGRTLLLDLKEDEQQSTSRTQPSRWPALLATLILLPAIAVGVYLNSDSWLLIGAKQDAPAWDYLLKSIESRVAAQPNDPEGLLMLARTRRASEDTQGAIEAYAQLNRLTNYSNAEYLTDEAETRVMAAQGAFNEVIQQRLQQALAAQPSYGRALWYAGLAALSLGDKAAALQHWRLLAKQELPQAFRQVLIQQLVKLGVPAAELAPTSTAENSLRIQLRIEAEQQLVKGLPGDTPIFVMAKPGSGQRSMLAVRKHRLDELPLQTQLTDGMNMAGGPQLSSTDHWRITVRISKSGDALPRSGDPFTTIDIKAADASQAIPVLINQIWP